MIVTRSSALALRDSRVFYHARPRGKFCLPDKCQFSLGRKRGWLRNRVLDPNFIRREGRHLSTREGGVYALTRYSYYAFWFRKWRSRWGQLSFRLCACSRLWESCINRKHTGRRHYVLKLQCMQNISFANIKYVKYTCIFMYTNILFCTLKYPKYLY